MASSPDPPADHANSSGPSASSSGDLVDPSGPSTGCSSEPAAPSSGDDDGVSDAAHAAAEAANRPGPHWIRRRPLVVTNASFGALYAVDGALVPFLSVYLAQVHGLSAGEIGTVMAVSAIAAVVAPPVVSVLADRYGHAERLLLVLMLCSALALGVFGFVEGYAGVLALYSCFCWAREPSRPLLDGIFFTSQRSVPELAGVSYHRVRIWATFGYMIPGLLLYFALTNDEALRTLPLVSCALAVVGVAVTYFLPSRTRARANGRGFDSRRPAPGPAAAPRPTFGSMLTAVGRLLRDSSTVLFMVAMFLLQASMAVYAAFYPLQVTEGVGLPARWVGIVSNLGVLIELAYMAAFGWLSRTLGWRWLMVIGAATAALRLTLLAGVSTVAVVVGTQVMHGMVIIVTMVAGRIIMDKKAPDEVRHTAQGLYAMLVLGGGRVVGSAAGGWVASFSLATAFWFGAAASALAAVLLFVALRRERPSIR